MIYRLFASLRASVDMCLDLAALRVEKTVSSRVVPPLEEMEGGKKKLSLPGILDESACYAQQYEALSHW